MECEMDRLEKLKSENSYLYKTINEQ